MLFRSIIIIYRAQIAAKDLKIDIFDGIPKERKVM
jgi:hypothetical protein